MYDDRRWSKINNSTLLTINICGIELENVT